MIPYALIVRALASGGLREYSIAEESLSEADERANFVGDRTARDILMPYASDCLLLRERSNLR